MFVIWGLPYGLGALYDFLQGQEFLSSEYPTLSHLIPNWLPPIWLIIGVIAIIGVTFEGAYRRIRQVKASDNWIDAYHSQHGELPSVPRYLIPLVGNYTRGPISKEIKLKIPSGQLWHRLLPSQKKEWRQLVEWLGKDPEDFLYQMRQMASKTPERPKGWRPFEQH